MLARESAHADTLMGFRAKFHEGLVRRTDALFELTDVVLTSAPVPSPSHLSLAPVYRRGWCSLSAALSKGRIDAETR